MLVNGLEEHFLASGVRGVRAIQMALEVALTNEVRERELRERTVGAGVSGAGSGADAGGARARPLARASIQPGPQLPLRRGLSPESERARRRPGTGRRQLCPIDRTRLRRCPEGGSVHQGGVVAKQGGGEAGRSPMREWVTICRDIRAATSPPCSTPKPPHGGPCRGPRG